MHKLFQILVAYLFLFNCISRAQLPPDNMQLFLLIGQSNMSGRGTVEEKDRATDPHIFMLTKEMSWVPAHEPLHFDEKTVGVGPGMSFARALLRDKPDITIGLIPCAVGATAIRYWQPDVKLPSGGKIPPEEKVLGGQCYNGAVIRAKEAMKKGVLAGILWHQGESDLDKIQSYEKNFQSLMTGLRKDLNAPDVPVVVGELGYFLFHQSEMKLFNENLFDIAASIPRCAVVKADGLIDRGDKLHFDAASERTLGERYEKAYIALVEQK